MGILINNASDMWKTPGQCSSVALYLMHLHATSILLRLVKITLMRTNLLWEAVGSVTKCFFLVTVYPFEFGSILGEKKGALLFLSGATESYQLAFNEKNWPLCS